MYAQIIRNCGRYLNAISWKLLTIICNFERYKIVIFNEKKDFILNSFFLFFLYVIYHNFQQGLFLYKIIFIIEESLWNCIKLNLFDAFETTRISVRKA